MFVDQVMNGSMKLSRLLKERVFLGLVGLIVSGTQQALVVVDS